MGTSLNEENWSEMSRDLNLKLKLSEESKEDHYDSEEEFHEVDEEYEEDDELEEEFSFATAFDGVKAEQISAEEAFDNGQIKPVFPLFNRDLLLGDAEDLEKLKMNDVVPNVKKVFLESNTDTNDSASTTGDDEIVGPYCEWSKKTVEMVPAGCKKSNSTGFCKLWRFKDVTLRCNSDGRDAFVFLNNTPSSSSATGEREQKVPVAESGKNVRAGEGKVNGTPGTGTAIGGEVKKVKKVAKNKKAALSPHEVYLRSKAKEGRRSYLPYRPGVVGFFTNVNGGGLTRNVHPF